MRGESGLTASDVALLSGRNGNNDGFGDNGSWWVIIFLIFAFMGWGRNGNGFGGGNGSGATDNYVLASDFATIQRQLSDGFGDLTSQTRYIQNGLCDGFYNMNTRDIVDTVNANYRALHDEIVANRIEDKNAQITAQQNEINALRLSASQSAQNAYLLSELKPCPSPSYIVPNPNCCYNYQVTSGCGNF